MLTCFEQVLSVPTVSTDSSGARPLFLLSDFEWWAENPGLVRIIPPVGRAALWSSLDDFETSLEICAGPAHPIVRTRFLFASQAYLE